MTETPKDITEVIPDLAEVRTAKQIRLDQLAAELGTDQVWSDGDRILAKVPPAVLEAAIAAHVADNEFDVPAERKVPPGIRAKVAEVRAGQATFTAAELQVLVAALALRGDSE